MPKTVKQVYREFLGLQPHKAFCIGKQFFDVHGVLVVVIVLPVRC
jgi:hypothetical protein